MKEQILDTAGALVAGAVLYHLWIHRLSDRVHELRYRLRKRYGRDGMRIR